MSRILSRLASLVWWSLLVVLVLLALYAAIGRQLTANINAYTDELATAISEQTGLSVSIGQLGSRWNWLDPTVLASDLVVRSPDSDTLTARLEHLQVRLDFWSSLRRLRIVFEEIEADGLALTLITRGELSLSEAGEELAPFLDTDNKPDWLVLAGQWLSDPQARITRVNIALGKRPDDLRDFYIPQLDLIYQQGLLQASGRAMQAGTSHQLASFALVGEHFFRGDFTGQFYVDIASGRLFDGLIDDLSWRDIRVEGFDLGGQAWLTFDQGKISEVQGLVSTPYLQLGAAQQSLAPLENIRASFGWRPGDALVLRQLQWQWQDVTVEPFSLRLQHRPDGLALVADELPLRPLRRLFQSLPLLPSRAIEALENYRPSGYLDDLFLLLPQKLDQFRMSGHLRDVAVRASQGAPGFSGLAGRLQLDADGGFLRIDSQQPGTLGFPKLFAGNWAFQSGSGDVTWQLDGPITRVYADNLRVLLPDNTRLTGAFDLRLDREGEDNLGIRVGVRNGDASRAGEFVPARIIDENLYQWVNDSIGEGRITAGEYYGHGRIDPGAPKGSFTSSMWFEFEQASVRYDPAWPALTEASGRVQVHNTSALITLEDGVSGGLDVAGASAQLMPGGEQADPTLKVNVSPTATGEDLSWWLANTPLGVRAGERVTNADYTGQFRIDLGIELPMREGDPQPVVQTRVRTEGAQFALPETGLEWNNIRGDLSYHTENGFSGGPVQAEFLGQPVAVHLAAGKSDGPLSVRQTGRLPVPEALWQVGLQQGRSLGLAGTLDYTAELSVGDNGGSVIALSSDLSGLSVDWPEPLGKSAEETAQLTATVDPYAAGGVKITGQWQDRLAFGLQWKPSGFDLVFNEFHLGEHRLEDVAINALDMGDHWIVHVDSDRATGRFVLPLEGGLVQAQLQTLRLVRQGQPPAKSDDTELLTLEEQLEAFRELDIGSWPDIDVSIARLWLGDQEAGSWNFQLRPEPGALNVRQVEGRLGSLTLSGDLLWSVLNSRETTRFQGTLAGGALRDLEALTGSSIPMNNEATNIELDLSWPGRPDEFSASRLDGSIRGRLDDGVILEESGSAQLFRVFNLLNTDTLWRRLKLDFSDLYEAGVAFDAISGKAKIVDGLVTMDPELQLAGPSGAFKLSGTTNISNENLDMRLVVVLPVTQNLPLAALLMGAGAPIGGALFVLDKVLGDPLSRLTSATYDVTGSWSDPKVDLRGVFDTD